MKKTLNLNLTYRYEEDLNDYEGEFSSFEELISSQLSEDNIKDFLTYIIQNPKLYTVRITEEN